MQYKKYETTLKIAEKKHQNLTKRLSVEQKELTKLRKAWDSGKERVRIAKKKGKSSNSQSMKNRVKATIKKHEQLSKQYDKQKTKVLRIKELIRNTTAEIKNIKTEKRQYEKAMEKYEKQWLQFYTSNLKLEDKKVAPVDKVSFGNQLRAARALLNLSTTEFSTLIGISTKLLSQIEQPNSELLLEPHLIKSIHATLNKAGVELINEGLYVNSGGVGVRIKKAPSGIRVSNPKDNKIKSQSTKSAGIKKKRRVKRVA